MRRYVFVIVAVVAAAGASAAQAAKSLYAGEETRQIKALPPDMVKMYLQGAGMGLAKAAELNGYPGPMHVLELAEELGLSEEQRIETEKLLAETKSEARRVGEEIVAAERELDGLFSSGSPTERELSRLVMEIGTKKAELRLVHLRAHVRQVAVLSPEQTSRYMALRGYHAGEGQHGGHHGR